MLDTERLARSANEVAELLSALASPNRLMILCNLLNGEMAVLPLAEAVGMSQSALSQQLAKLRALKLVSARREGRTIYYSVASDKVARILGQLYDMYCVTTDKQARGQEAAAA
ncbi:MAG: metalloregulator ArsR/SmtB family transcription factor [Rhizobiaceae bacterium]